VDAYQERALAVLGDRRWHHADDLRSPPNMFDSQILSLMRSLKSKGYPVEWRSSPNGDWYRLRDVGAA